MKKIILKIFISLILLLTVDSLAQSYEWQWVKSITNDGNTIFTEPVADSDGNLYTVCNFIGTSITIGEYNFSYDEPTVRFYIIKYNTSGQIIWLKDYIQNGTELNVQSINIDNYNNIYFTGTLMGSIALDNGTTITSEGFNYNLFLIKMTSAGDIIWTKTTAGYSFNNVTVLHDNNLYISGDLYSETLSFNNTVIHKEGECDYFLIKTDLEGNVIWTINEARTINSQYDSQLVVDSEKNVHIAGNYSSDEIVFGNNTFYNNGESNIFYVKYDSNGNYLQGNSYGGNFIDTINDLACDTNDNIYLTGGFSSGSLTIGENTLTGYHDGFLAKFSNTMTPVWVKQFSGENSDTVMGVKTDNEGYVYISCFFNSPVITIDNLELANEGINNLFVAKLNPDGEAEWVKKTGGDSRNLFTSMTIDQNSNIFITGLGNGNFNFDDINVTGPDDEDSLYLPYIAKLSSQSLHNDKFKSMNSSLYPNPAKNILTINADIVSNSNYTIIDMTGRIVQKGNLSNRSVNVAALPPGLYIININGLKSKFIKE